MAHWLIKSGRSVCIFPEGDRSWIGKTAPFPEGIVALLKKLNVPVTLPRNLAEKDLIDLIKHDKKAVNKWPRFVLLNDIGQVYCPDGQYAVDVAPEILGRVLKKL